MKPYPLPPLSPTVPPPYPTIPLLFPAVAGHRILTLREAVELAPERAEHEHRVGDVVDEVDPHAEQHDADVSRRQVHQVGVDGGAHVGVGSRDGHDRAVADQGAEEDDRVGHHLPRGEIW